MYDFMHAYTNDCLVVGSLGFSQALWMPNVWLVLRKRAKITVPVCELFSYSIGII